MAPENYCTTAQTEREQILDYFEPQEGTTRTGSIQRLYQMFAHSLVASLAQGPERTVALRKLLESREAALRCSIYR